jgi:hypothetical protein
MEVMNVLFNFSLEAVISCSESHVRSLWAGDLIWRFCDAVRLLFQSTCLHCKLSAPKLVTEVPCRGKHSMSISCYRLLSFYPHSPEAHSSLSGIVMYVLSYYTEKIINTNSSCSRFQNKICHRKDRTEYYVL